MREEEEVGKGWMCRGWEGAETGSWDVEAGAGLLWRGGGCERNDRQSVDERESEETEMGILSGVSEFESEGRRWNEEEPRLIVSQQKGIEELLLPGMSWRGVSALYRNGKCVCVYLYVYFLRTNLSFRLWEWADFWEVSTFWQVLTFR